CRQGYGTLLAKLAAPLPLLLGTPVKTIEWWSRARIEVDTPKGQFKTGAVILTVSTNVLTGGKIKLAPDLPKRHLEAATKLKLGSRDHVALELTGNPLGLRSDELVFEKTDGRQTAAIFGNASGSTICIVDIGGNFGRDLSAKGEAGMIDFVMTWLAGLYGTDMKSIVKRRHATRWNHEPWVLGATSAAAPGAQSARKVLAEPISGRIFLAGEATHETRWGTVNGAWESGERAADAAVKLLGGPSRRTGAPLPTQRAAGVLADLSDDLSGPGLDLCVGQCFFPRLQCHADGDRLLAGLYPHALVDVEHRDIDDELAVGALCRAQHVGGVHRAVDDERKIALHWLERGKLQRRPRAGCLRLRFRDFFEHHLEGGQRALGVERFERARMQLST